MTTPEIQIVTRTCITCRYEPEWRFSSPLAGDYTGRCNSPLVHNGPLRISREQQVATYEGQPITCCPGWLPKQIEAGRQMTATERAELFGDNNRGHS